jgi:TonB family protein
MGAKKILIVDFDQEFLRFLSRFLRGKGFAVVTAADGSAGLEIHKNESPDLVITEAMLPRLHGFELCSRISHSPSRKTPVIIVTGVYRDNVYKTEALHTFGAAAYFEKPLDPEELAVTVRKILGLPEPQAKPEEDLDAAIMESLVSERAAPRPAMPAAAKASVKDEVDVMLRDTLAEFGLKTAKKKAAPAPKSWPATLEPPPASKPEPSLPAEAAAPKPSVPAPQGLSAPEPGPAPVRPASPTPPPPRAKTVEPVSAPPVPIAPPIAKPKPYSPAPVDPPSWAPHAVVAAASPLKNVPAAAPPSFGGYSEPRKKSSSTRIFGAIAGVLVLTSATIFVLKPGKPRSSADPVTGLSAGETGPRADVLLPAPEPAATEGQAPRAGKKTPQAAAKDAKPALGAVENKPRPEPADIQPLVPEASPKLEIQAPAPDTPPASPGEQPPAADGGTAAAATDVPAEVPAANVKAGDLVPLGNVDTAPRQVRTSEPVYPVAARSLGREGSILINVLISETGDVIQTAVIGGSKGSLGFDKAAENAVRKWKYEPARKDGVPVRVWKTVTIAFKLQK